MSYREIYAKHVPVEHLIAGVMILELQQALLPGSNVRKGGEQNGSSN